MRSADRRRVPRFSIPEVDLGIPLAWGGIQRLVREIGPAATRELVLTCRPFSAAEAKALGMLNTVAADGEHLVEAQALAENLAAKSRLTLRATLKAVDAAAEALVPTGTAWSDADALINAMHDPESRAVGQEYLRARVGRNQYPGGRVGRLHRCPAAFPPHPRGRSSSASAPSSCSDDRRGDRHGLARPPRRLRAD